MQEQLLQVLWTVLGVMDYGWTEWKPLVFAALAAAAVVIINVLNPKDSRYGLGAGSSE